MFLDDTNIYTMTFVFVLLTFRSQHFLFQFISHREEYGITINVSKHQYRTNDIDYYRLTMREAVSLLTYIKQSCLIFQDTHFGSSQLRLIYFILNSNQDFHLSSFTLANETFSYESTFSHTSICCLMFYEFLMSVIHSSRISPIY